MSSPDDRGGSWTLLTGQYGAAGRQDLGQVHRPPSSGPGRKAAVVPRRPGGAEPRGLV
ncbi:MAG TPA: hypothetical protein VFW50_27115 [Streptosporangiaceae bacterium]|nr:hypothetical protein [Streptosporangiaceae bacterium]